MQESLSCIKGIKEERKKLMKERAALAKEKVQLEEDKVILEEQTAKLQVEVKLKERTSMLKMEQGAIEEEMLEPSSKRIKTAFHEEKTSELADAIEKFDLTEELTDEAEVLVEVLPPNRSPLHCSTNATKSLPSALSAGGKRARRRPRRPGLTGTACRRSRCCQGSLIPSPHCFGGRCSVRGSG